MSDRVRFPAPVEFDPRGEVWADPDEQYPITLETERGDGAKRYDHMTVAQARQMSMALQMAADYVGDSHE